MAVRKTNKSRVNYYSRSNAFFIYLFIVFAVAILALILKSALDGKYSYVISFAFLFGFLMVIFAIVILLNRYSAAVSIDNGVINIPATTNYRDEIPPGYWSLLGNSDGSTMVYSFRKEQIRKAEISFSKFLRIKMVKIEFKKPLEYWVGQTDLLRPSIFKPFKPASEKNPFEVAIALKEPDKFINDLGLSAKNV
ncbi:MAG: hypothetical protein Q7R70_04550 [Candidatus Diapherotrites archaeon]|nr:hypothetical protein [Candidatus Diapherotrites archaeon]